MNAENAIRITRAASSVYMVLIVGIAPKDYDSMSIIIRFVAGLTKAQIETASEVVEAINEEAYKQQKKNGGPQSYYYTIGAEAADVIIDEAKKALERTKL